MAVECFRWLLSAIDQTADDMLGFYLDWRAHRVSLRPDLVGSVLRRSYVGRDFRSDFKKQMTAALITVEDALVQGTQATVQSGQQIPPGQPLWWSDVPSTTKFTGIVELQCNLQKIVEALKSRANSALGERQNLLRDPRIFGWRPKPYKGFWLVGRTHSRL